MNLPPLDPLLHQPARTQLVAYLQSRGKTTFSELKRVLGITDGNLGSHLNKLVEAGYVATSETCDGARTQTAYALTPVGRRALGEYVKQLSALMGLGKEGEPLVNSFSARRTS